MSEQTENQRTVFISYSSVDRDRTNPLGLFVQGLGRKVFHDHRSILPGRDWHKALMTALDQTGTLVVFWTKNAAKSKWVRREYEHFIEEFPERPLIPIRADKTDLTPLLASRQAVDFNAVLGVDEADEPTDIPAVDGAEAQPDLAVWHEVLLIKERMEGQKGKEGTVEAIAEAVVERLEKEGIEVVTDEQRRDLFYYLGFGWTKVLEHDFWGFWGWGFKKVGRWLASVAGRVGFWRTAVVGGLTLWGGVAAANTVINIAAPVPPPPIDLHSGVLQRLADEMESMDGRVGSLQDDLAILIDWVNRPDPLGDILAGIDGRLANVEEEFDGLRAAMDSAALSGQEALAAARAEILEAIRDREEPAAWLSVFDSLRNHFDTQFANVATWRTEIENHFASLSAQLAEASSRERLDQVISILNEVQGTVDRMPDALADAQVSRDEILRMLREIQFLLGSLDTLTPEDVRLVVEGGLTRHLDGPKQRIDDIYRAVSADMQAWDLVLSQIGGVQASVDRVYARLTTLTPTSVDLRPILDTLFAVRDSVARVLEQLDSLPPVHLSAPSIAQIRREVANAIRPTTAAIGTVGGRVEALFPLHGDSLDSHGPGFLHAPRVYLIEEHLRPTPDCRFATRPEDCPTSFPLMDPAGSERFGDVPTEVIVEARIDANGRVTRVESETEQANAALQDMAERIVRSWRFNLVDPERAPITMLVVVVFHR